MLMTDTTHCAKHSVTLDTNTVVLLMSELLEPTPVTRHRYIVCRAVITPILRYRPPSLAPPQDAALTHHHAVLPVTNIDDTLVSRYRHAITLNKGATRYHHHFATSSMLHV